MTKETVVSHGILIFYVCHFHKDFFLIYIYICIEVCIINKFLLIGVNLTGEPAHCVCFVNVCVVCFRNKEVKSGQHQGGKWGN